MEHGNIISRMNHLVQRSKLTIKRICSFPNIHFMLSLSSLFQCCICLLVMNEIHMFRIRRASYFETDKDIHQKVNGAFVNGLSNNEDTKHIQKAFFVKQMNKYISRY